MNANVMAGMTQDDAPQVLLITAQAAAQLCGKSSRTWRTWDAAGWIPMPVRIGRSTLWRVDELKAWIAAGCPRREIWNSPKSRRFPAN